MRLFLSAFIAFIIVFPIYIIKEAIISANPKKRDAERERLKQLAIDRGHVVMAEFVSSQAFSVDQPGSIMQTGRVGIYEYEYNGRKYKFRYRADDLSPTMTLYFINNPRKATVARALKDSKISWPLVFVVVDILIYLIIGSLY